MSERLEPLILRDFSQGIHTNISPGIVGPNVLKYAFNCYVEPNKTKTGTMISRDGIDTPFGKINSDIAAVDADDEICGLFSFLPNELLAAVDTNGGSSYVYYYDASSGVSAGTWVDTGGVPHAWTNNSPIRFEYFPGLGVFAADGNEILFWDTNTANNWASTHLTSAPTGQNLLRLFQGKLYTAKTAISARVHFSSLIESATITWDTSTQFIDFTAEKSLGGGFTGLEVNGDYLLIFFGNTFFTYDGTATQTSPLFQVGAVNQDVIQTINGKTFFLHKGDDYYGVYVYEGTEPAEISDPIKEFLKKANLVSADGIEAEFGSWNDNINYYLSISDVTIEGITFSNVVLVYNIPTSTWTVMNIPNNPGSYNNFFKYSTPLFYSPSAGTSTIFDDVSVPYFDRYTVIGGTPLGTSTSSDTSIAPVVWAPSSEIGDDIGESANNLLTIFLQTQELEFGSRALIKQLNKFSVFSSGNCGDMSVTMRIDGGEWSTLGNLIDKITTFEPGQQGHYFEFRITGINTGEKFVFEGFEFFDVRREDYVL